MRIRFGSASLTVVALGLASCGQPAALNSQPVPTSSAAPVNTPIPERDFAAFAAKMQGATVLDVDRFTPVTTIGEKCITKPLLGASATLAPKLVAALEAAKAYSLKQQGVSLLVMKDGAVLHRSFAEGVDATTPTDSYSMHKSVLALVIGLAIDDGIIASLDDPVGDYLAEWQGDPRGDITLRQVLTMSTGLQLAKPPEGVPAMFNLSFASDANSVVLASTQGEAPGNVFAYGNHNSQVAGTVLERALTAAGKGTYAEYIENKLWCPLGNNKADLWLDREGGSPHYYAGLFTHIENWARVGEMIRNEGMADGKQIVPAAWIAEMGKPSTANPSYGLHVWRGSPWNAQRAYSAASPMKVIHSEPYLADDVLFFDGFGGQRVYIIPSAGVTIVRTGIVNFAFDDAKIVNLVLAGLK